MKKNRYVSGDIDIVLPWVDGADPVWQKSRAIFDEVLTGDYGEERYRDWGLLRYVFRGIEKYLPWVRKVHFITCGQKPEWLNTSCKKLHLVNHEDYIPAQWLPTFSANPIELNIHRISDLSEQFIYTNDDSFFLQLMKPEDFFYKGLPKSQAGLNIINEIDRTFTGILYSDLEVINRQFFSRKVFLKKLNKFINIKYGAKANYKSLSIASWCFGYFPGLPYFHGPNAYLKSTLEEVWEKEENTLCETSSHRFRTYQDVNQYLFLWWQWCKGEFVPTRMDKKLKYVSVDKEMSTITDSIINPACPLLCINDASISDFHEKKLGIISAFESILGEKSNFEL